MKSNQSIQKLRCENVDDELFENLLEDFLNSYVVRKVDEEKIEATIDELKTYMPKYEVQAIANQSTILDKIKNNVDLVKFQFGLISKGYLILSLLLILAGTISTVRLNLSIYVSASIIAPIPMLLGIFEIIKGREENVWELELSYKYSLREIVLSKLIIINVMSVLISIIICISLNNAYSDINLLKMISIWLIPIFALSSITLIITSIYRSINSITLCIAIWILGVMSIGIYERISDIANINTFVALGISVLSVVMASKLFYKKSICSIDYRTFDF